MHTMKMEFWDNHLVDLGTYSTSRCLPGGALQTQLPIVATAISVAVAQVINHGAEVPRGANCCETLLFQPCRR